MTMTFGFSLNAAIGALPGLEQNFSTIPLSNFNTALYELAIRAPGSSQALISAYTFPISPSAVQKEVVAMTNIFDVRGSAAQNGVQRIADTYGDAPPIFVIRGTTGWQYHSTDGFAFTGLDSIIAVENLLQQFAQLNQVQAQVNQPLYTLEFYDYFKGEFWQVVPMGPQGISQSNRRPLLFDYVFRFAAIRSLDSVVAITINDPLAIEFSTPAAEAQSSLSLSITASLSSYTSVTPGGSSLLIQPALAGDF